jgi:hypothetical protein
MQLNLSWCKRRKHVAKSLAAATCALLGSASGPSVAEEATKAKEWHFDTSLSYYDETDGITDASADVLVKRAFRRGLMALRVTVDSLTGASANSAVPANVAQTFTTPSGNSTYSAAPGERPLDPTFLDTRVAISANWLRAAGKKGSIDVGLSVSSEYDYTHLGGNARYSRDYNQRNTTLSFGLAFASDTIDPEGGVPIPLAAMLAVGDTSNKLGDDSKTVVDALFGVTQVLGRNTVAQFNYSFSSSSGYMTDPFKLISVVDGVTGELVAGPVGVDYRYLFEVRPDERTKHSVFTQIKHSLGRNILHGSYRYMTDDWGIDSHTLDFRWRRPIGDNWYVQPHVRYYMQGDADFYSTVLIDGDPLPEHVSADHRLGELDTITFGVKVGHPIGAEKEWSGRIEYYTQTTRGSPGIGASSALDYYPGLDAVIVQFGYRF